MISFVVGSALLDTLALPQLAYLICFLAGLVVATTHDGVGLALRPAPPRRAKASLVRPRLIGEQ
jgi:hypothetical protein